MRQITLTFLLSAILALTAFSQDNYRNGYVVKNNGDTLKGFINYRQWNLSPTSIEFKQNNTDSQAITFDAGSLKNFEVAGLEKYVSYAGLISIDKINTREPSQNLDTTKRLDTIFLKVINAGQHVTLLYHEDKMRHRYFLIEAGASPTELEFHQYFNEQRKIVNYTPYKDQLINLIKKYGRVYDGIEYDINRLSYTDDIIKYSRLINNDTSKIVKNSVGGVRFFIGAGASYNIATFNGPKAFNYTSNYTSITPTINFGIDLLVNKNIQKSFFKIEGSIFSISPTYTSSVGYFTSKQISASITPQFIYNIYNTNKLKYFIGGGLGLVFTNVSDSKLVATESGRIINIFYIQGKGETGFKTLNAGEYISNPYEIAKVNLSLQVRTGVLINKTIEVFLSATPFKFFDEKLNNFTYKNQRVVFGFNYLFAAK